MKDRYTDEYYDIHTVKEILGQGGQGAVYKTDDPDLAIKFVVDERGEPLVANADKSAAKFKNIRLLPLPKDIPISLPLAVLKDAAGYVMQLLDELMPVKDFFISGKTPQDFFEKNKEKISDKLIDYPNGIKYYCITGGTKKRIDTLYKAACILARVHGCGLIYGDISDNNVFVSSDPDFSTVYFIDADNIRFDGTKGSVVFTHKYVAPEIANGLANAITPQSDVWAFAVMLFHTICMAHPFVGQCTEEPAETDDFAEEQDEEIDKGLFAFVDDTDDDSNRTDNGLDRKLVLTERLSALFQRTFSKDGKDKPFLRPAIWNWAINSARAADKMIVCPGCGMSYYYDYVEQDEPNCGKHQCPYCGEKRPKIIRFESRLYTDGKAGKPCWEFIVAEKTTLIPQRVFNEFRMTNYDEPVLGISFDNGNIVLKRIQDNIPIYWANEKELRFQKIYGDVKDQSGRIKTFWLFAESANPRMIRVEILEGRS